MVGGLFGFHLPHRLLQLLMLLRNLHLQCLLLARQRCVALADAIKLRVHVRFLRPATNSHRHQHGRHRDARGSWVCTQHANVQPTV
jgi:hypothetical protein